MKQAFIWGSILCLFSCGDRPPSTHQEHIPTVTLTQGVTADTFGSFGVLTDMQPAMNWYRGELFLPDFEGSRILATGSDLVAGRQIGREGQGPGELSWAGVSTLSNDRIFVDSNWVRQLVVYDIKGTYLQSIPLGNTSVTSRFAVLDDIVFLPTPAEDQPISARDFDGVTLYRMGTHAFDDQAEARARGKRHVLLTELEGQSVLVAVGVSEPTIELFSPDGTLLHRANIEKTPALRPRIDVALDAYKHNPDKRHTTYILFRDAVVHGDTLFIVFLKPDKTQILKCKLGLKEVAVLEVLDPPEPLNIRSIAYDGKDTFFVYNQINSEIRSLHLPN